MREPIGDAKREQRRTGHTPEDHRCGLIERRPVQKRHRRRREAQQRQAGPNSITAVARSRGFMVCRSFFGKECLGQKELDLELELPTRPVPWADHVIKGRKS